MATMTNAQAIERLQLSKHRYMISARHPHADPMILVQANPVNEPDGYDNEMWCHGAAWASEKATYEQLKRLDLMVTLAAIQPLPIDGLDPAGQLMVSLFICDDDGGVDEVVKGEMFGTTISGAIPTREQVQTWIAGAMTFWRGVKDVL